MTTPINPGDIVSVPDPSTGGAGAPVITSQIINANYRNGMMLLNRAFALGDDAIGIASPAPQMLIPDVDKSYLPPTPPALPPLDPNEAKQIYDDARSEIEALLQAGYGTFLNTYFADGAYYTAAIGWLDQAITSGGTGINVDVERQLWERDRARINSQTVQAEQEASVTWANRGFALPPGALVGQVHQIRLESSRQLAAQSRDIAIKTFEAELENVRFAVQQAIDLRIKALASTAEYVRTLILGPQTAVQLATGLAGLRTEMARALTAMYTAQVAALEPTVRLAITDAQIQASGAEANLRSQSQAVNDRTRAALQNATMVGNAASAMLNGINASSSISGSDSSSV